MIGLVCWAGLLLLAAAPPDEPVRFRYLRDCGPEPGRQRAYDPEARRYDLHCGAIAGFDVLDV